MIIYYAVGERGINLSGGQKARVSLARSFMSACRSQIFLLDDPFSAVDGATGNWIFERGVMGLLNDKIRVVALNSHLHLLRHFDRIIVLDNGSIVADGAPQELARTQGELISKVTGFSPEELLTSYANSPLPGSSGEYSTSTLNLTAVSQTAEKSEQGTTTTNGKVSISHQDNDDSLAAIQQPVPAKAEVALKVEVEGTAAVQDSAPKSPPKALIEKERASAGSVSYATYIKYFAASLIPRDYYSSQRFYESTAQADLRSWGRFLYGLLILCTVLLLFVISQAARVGVDYFLLHWAAAGGQKHSTLSTVYYSCLGVLVFTLVARYKFLNYFALLSSHSIHAAVFRTVMSASVPLFYDTHTIGEVLNRFAKDCETLDVNIPEFMLQMLANWLQILSIFALCIYASPWFALILLPLGFGFYGMFQFFSCVSRDMKKLEAVTRSPIYAALSETLTGLETIRAYGDTQRFLRNYLTRMERNEKFFYHLWMSMSWVTARLELASTFVLLSVSVLTVCLRSSVSPIALGLALAYSLQLTALFQRTVQLTIDVTTYMTSTERICEYLSLTQEQSVVAVTKSVALGGGGGNGDGRGGGSQDKNEQRTLAIDHGAYQPVALPSMVEEGAGDTAAGTTQQWTPKTGTIVFDNVWLTYRDNPAVLKGVSFSVRHGERVGVCGRTGAGKVSKCC